MVEGSCPSTLTTSWLMGVEKATQYTSTANEMKVMLISCTMALIFGAMRIATSEFVPVCTQVDTIKFQAEKDLKLGRHVHVDQRAAVSSARQTAVASSLAYVIWGAGANTCSLVYKRSSFEVFNCPGCSFFVNGGVGSNWRCTWKSSHYEVLCLS